MPPTGSSFPQREGRCILCGQTVPLQSTDGDALPVSMETVGGREKPLPGDDRSSTVGRSDEVEAHLPGPPPFQRVGAPDDAVEGGGTPAAAFRRGRGI